MNFRENAVAGIFYPNNCDEIKKYINRFNEILDNANYNANLDFTPRSIISPHAGYVYSGFTANIAFKTLWQNNLKVKRIVVIGPSHKVYLEGASVALYEDYKTPCKDLKIDLI